MDPSFGFSGKMRSGKDTAAEYVRRHNPQYVTHGLAVALKRLCTDLEFTPVPDVTSQTVHEPNADTAFIHAYHFVSSVRKRYGVGRMAASEAIHQLVAYTEQFRGQAVQGKNRRLLQEVAEYLRAKVSPDLWVDLLLDEFKESAEPFLVPDVRKPHEVDDLRRAGFKIIRINVSPEVQKQRILAAGELYDPVALNFYTEVALDDYTGFDAVIENNGTLAEFEHELDTVLANAYR